MKRVKNSCMLGICEREVCDLLGEKDCYKGKEVGTNVFSLHELKMMMLNLNHWFRGA